jgi:hypothetical protein
MAPTDKIQSSNVTPPDPLFKKPAVDVGFIINASQAAIIFKE